jgi:hypothetical protein
MSAPRDDFDTFILDEIAETDRAAFVFEDELALAFRVFLACHGRAEHLAVGGLIPV